MMDNGISNLRYGTLYKVDLSGSKRVNISGATGAAIATNEESEINVGLTTLGCVMSKVCPLQYACLKANKNMPTLLRVTRALQYLNAE